MNFGPYARLLYSKQSLIRSLAGPLGRIGTFMKPSIFRLSLPELEQIVIPLCEPPYRAGQILSQLYDQFVEWEGMTNLPLHLREKLPELIDSPVMEVKEILSAPDRATRKFLLALDDGSRIESVILENRGRPPTLCVSSQVGCPLGCRFCATGLSGFVRNLRFDELVGQVWHLMSHLKREHGGKPSPNLVFMGMGEPLLNRQNLFEALRAITDPERIGLGDRHITVSTIGIPEGILEFAKLNLQVGLALSLHHPDEKKRRELMPHARATLKEIFSSLKEYARMTRRLVTFEYVLLDQVNDSDRDAAEVANWIEEFGHPALVNLIPFNPVEGTPFGPSGATATARFVRRLKQRGIRTTVRRSQGNGIRAACGQLTLKSRNRQSS